MGAKQNETAADSFTSGFNNQDSTLTKMIRAGKGLFDKTRKKPPESPPTPFDEDQEKLFKSTKTSFGVK